MQTNQIKIVKQTGFEGGEFLSAAMPDGTIIPAQVDLTLKSLFETPDYVMVEFTLQAEIPLDEFEILKNTKGVTVNT